ncbi:tRNA-guanine transglycosylase [Canariomyces notabilis]|uniref:Queuine tRNA-ribosyltransferase accessory subunit 2 n=1 Tax=Canariomyces notabilis TaxID=2074819 RepID=A0AAN6YUC4_9PEZI|nr:tRNA-guanine transglycosylase [Canariomyces arenarius]
MTVDIPDGDQEAMRFEILGSVLKDGAAARLGRLTLPGRRPIDTPNFVGVTSRGVLPHLTPDNVSKHLQVSSAYMALEDFIEKPQQYSKRVPPIFSTPTTTKQGTPLHSFTAMPPSVTTILSARRLPAVPPPNGNTNDSISVFTSTGFQVLPTKEYLSAVQTLKPDIAIPPADLTHGPVAPNSKRALRMAERTDEWVVEWFSSLSRSSSSPQSTFAPVLPISHSIQWEYLARLAEDYLPSSQLHGLAFYDADVLPDIAAHTPSLVQLPLLSLLASQIQSQTQTPHHILRQISLGIDLFAIPFVNAASDAGLALTFRFPPPPHTTTTNGPLLPLATDLSLPESNNTTSLAPLAEDCTCYTCTSHHRAYVHHLLSAREMLGWTLLQVHNHAVMAAFFAGVRAALAEVEGGNDKFEVLRKEFALAYEPDFPEGMAQRPRARGYQYKSAGGGEGKRNKPAWGKLGGAGVDVDGNGEAGISRGGAEETTGGMANGEGAYARDLEGRGFAQVQN